MILMTSNGLSSSNLIQVVTSEVKKSSFKEAAIIVTADNEYKKDNYNILRLVNELNQCGLNVRLFDYDEDDVSELDDCEVILINGGNPFYLLDRLNKYNAKAFFEKFISENKILIGYSAGSVVLQNNIELLSKYAIMTNFLNLTDLSAMGLVNIEVLPHYAKFSNIFNNFKEICSDYETEKKIEVIKLNDGMGVLYDVSDDSFEIIK